MQQFVFALHPARRNEQRLGAARLLLGGKRRKPKLETGNDAQFSDRCLDGRKRLVPCPALIGFPIAERIVQTVLAVRSAQAAAVVKNRNRVVRQTVRALVHACGNPQAVSPAKLTERNNERAVTRLCGLDIFRPCVHFCVIHAVFRQKQHFRFIFRCRLCKVFYFPEIGSFVLPGAELPDGNRAHASLQPLQMSTQALKPENFSSSGMVTSMAELDEPHAGNTVSNRRSDSSR